MPTVKRKLYNGAYRQELDNQDTHLTDPNAPDGDGVNTSGNDPEDNLTADEKIWKKRYGDLRTHNNSLTERIRELQSQLSAAQKKEIQIPSTEDELKGFANKYPDIYRHIRSIAMTELLQERENLSVETKAVKDELESIKHERGLQLILKKHPDFYELNNSEEFKTWAQEQPTQIQDWLFENDDPTLCIKAIDLYKTEHNFKRKSQPNRSNADTFVDTRSQVQVDDSSGKKIWKLSEISRLTNKQFEKFEEEIDAARAEGRIVDDMRRSA